MRALLLCALALLGPVGAARAQNTPTPGTLYDEWSEARGRDREGPPPQFTWINYFIARGTVSNQVGDPAGLRGVSLGPIGSIAGSAVRTGDDAAYYLEQRWIPVFSFAPWFVDGLAAFRAQLEVDFLWGRAANTVQPNEGGGFNADQVNIQTKNVNVSIYPTRDPARLDIVIGMQSVYDSILDPTLTPLDTLVSSGYKLAFLGSDAAGVVAYARPFENSRAKLAFLPLQSAQPDKATEDDPRLKWLYLITADWQQTLAPATHVGLSLWRLRDDTEGDAFAYEGLVRSGPAAQALASYTGVATFNMERPSGTVWYLGTFFDHNLDHRMGRLGGSGFVMANVGSYESDVAATMLNPEVDIFGVAANLELRYRWGARSGDAATLQGMFTTGDSDLTDDRYSGVFTMNQYGLPGAVWFTHRTLLLFPFTSTVNNYTGAVTDIGNQGYGLIAAIATGAWDVIPSKLNLKLGAAYARTSVDPPPLLMMERGRSMGLEINGELRWTIRHLMTLGLHAGMLLKGDYYDNHPTVKKNPWAAFTTFTWYAF
jgi:hypothetical protein